MMIFFLKKRRGLVEPIQKRKEKVQKSKILKKKSECDKIGPGIVFFQNPGLKQFKKKKKKKKEQNRGEQMVP